MPSETDNIQFSDEQVHRSLSEWQDEGYHVDTDHGEEMEKHDRFMEGMRQHREKRESEAAAQNQTTDFPAIIEKNVSRTKRIPIVQLTDNWSEKEQAAQK